MPTSTAVDRLYNEAQTLLLLLEGTAEVSLRVAAADNLRKGLLLAAASHFENELSDVVLRFVRETSGSELVESFVRNKAVARQYHSWFDWEKSQANKFFSLFGATFKTAMVARVGNSEELKSAIAAFLELGNERNKLVHQDYATFQLEKDLEEIYSLYKTARAFVDQLPAFLRDANVYAQNELNDEAPKVS